MNRLINVGLYGDGSRSSRLRAEHIYCDRADECSAYKEGKCFQVTTPFGRRCKFGHINQIDGGTKQSKRYHTLHKESKENELYAKLSYPHDSLVTRIGNGAFLTLPHIYIEEQDGKLWCKDPGFSSNHIYVNLDNLTPENIKRVCEYQPYAFLGGVIEEYQRDVVPMFLHQLSQLFPEQFQAFVSAYPDYEIRQPNWIGRHARLSTCNREMEYKDCYGNVFHFEGDEIVCDQYRSSFLPFGAKVVTFRLPVTDKMTVKITDNNQVTNETVFT